MRLAGKVAIVTGAASGMGASTAKIFAKEGAKVVVADMNEADGKAVVEEITKANGSARFQKLDVASEAQWNDAVAAAVSAFGKLDILVNNAGISGSAVTDFLDTKAWNDLMSINSSGVFFGMKAAVGAMRKAGGGAIVNISSVSGIVGQPNVHMGYNASKGAVRIMSKSAAVQFAKDGVRVNSVHPGLMPPMRTSGRTADPATREKMLRQVPLRRAGRVEEVGYAVLFLASDEASYITGTELVVDGGWTAM
jgi:NAD(P)-dependent dehydrogenase (short-subunit alcohol dehydrogenase family)